MWYSVIQAMLGKLYVLSLYSTLYVPLLLVAHHQQPGATNPFWRACRNNRIELTTEPPVTYISTINASLDGVGSPMRRYVFSVHFPDQEQQRVNNFS